MINDEKIAKLAQLQLQLAVIDGEPWAIKHILGGTRLNIVSRTKFDLSSLSDEDLQTLSKMAKNDKGEFDELTEIESDSCNRRS